MRELGGDLGQDAQEASRPIPSQSLVHIKGEERELGSGDRGYAGLASTIERERFRAEGQRRLGWGCGHVGWARVFGQAAAERGNHSSECATRDHGSAHD